MSWFNLVVLAMFVLYAIGRVDTSKTLVWLIINGVVLAGLAAVFFFHPNVYFVLGAVSTVVAVVRSYLAGSTPWGNPLTFAKTLVSHLAFWPVEDFETAYGLLRDKV